MVLRIFSVTLDQDKELHLVNKMNTILLLYSSTDGHTEKIARSIGAVLEDHAQQLTIASLSSFEPANLASFDKIVVAASIRYGKHKPEVSDFVVANRALLEEKIGVFITVNLVARKPEKNTPDTNPYIKKFLAKVNWQPHSTAVFAGKLNYPRYGWLDRLMIRFIMWMTNGPTDPTAVVDFTDWDQVEAYGRELAGLQ